MAPVAIGTIPASPETARLYAAVDDALAGYQTGRTTMAEFTDVVLGLEPIRRNSGLLAAVRAVIPAVPTSPADTAATEDELARLVEVMAGVLTGAAEADADEWAAFHEGWIILFPSAADRAALRRIVAAAWRSRSAA